MWGAGQDQRGYRISSHGSGELATPASMGGGRTGSEVKAALAGPGSWLVRTGQVALGGTRVGGKVLRLYSHPSLLLRETDKAGEL